MPDNTPEQFRKDISPRTEEAIIRDLLNLEDDIPKNRLEARLANAASMIQVLGLLGIAPLIGEIAEEEGKDIGLSNTADAQRIKKAGQDLIDLLKKWRSAPPKIIDDEERIIIAYGLELSVLPTIKIYQEYGNAIPGLESASSGMDQDVAIFKEAAMRMRELCDKSGYALTPYVRNRVTDIENSRRGM